MKKTLFLLAALGSTHAATAGRLYSIGPGASGQRVYGIDSDTGLAVSAHRREPMWC